MALNGLSDSAQGIANIFQKLVEQLFIEPRTLGNTLKKFYNISVVLSPSLSFNASVHKSPSGNVFFQFNLGSGFAIGDLIMSLISEPDFFSEVPLDLSLVLEGPQVPHRFSDYSWLLSEPGSPQIPFISKKTNSDINRYPLGDHLNEMAAKFVVLHELMHFILGHVNFVNERGLSFEINEIPQSPHGEIPAKLLRGFELNADQVALAVLIKAGRIKAARNSAHLKTIKTPIDWDRTILLAISLVFMLIELNENRIIKNIDQRTHPSAAARTMNAFMYYDQFIHKQSQNRLTVNEVFTPVLDDLAVASNITGVLPLTLENFIKVFLAEVSSLKDVEVWREIYDNYQVLIQNEKELERCRKEILNILGLSGLEKRVYEELKENSEPELYIPVYHLPKKYIEKFPESEAMLKQYSFLSSLYGLNKQFITKWFIHKPWHNILDFIKKIERKFGTWFKKN